jgi:flagellar protein FliS
MASSSAEFDTNRAIPGSTTSPGRMIVALYERLALDLGRAQQAIESDDPAIAHDCLLHAQQIVAELHDSLDIRTWHAARRLKGIYVFLLFELVAANVDKDATRVASCRELVVPLHDAWHEVAGIVPSTARNAPRPARLLG